MHGRPRLSVEDEASQDPKLLEAQKKKVQLYLRLQDAVLASHRSQCFTPEAILQSARLLELNPDVYTAWNYRKLAVKSLLKECSSDAECKEIADVELRLTEVALRKNPKSYGAWYHRKWTVLLGLSDLEREFALVAKLLSMDARNFHGWDYRRFIASLSCASPSTELDYTLSKINENFSNYSAWHYRSKLLPTLHGGTHSSSPTPQLMEWGKTTRSESAVEEGAAAASPIQVSLPPSVLSSEFELVRQALFTEPEDQSGWMYHSWLLQQTLPPPRPQLLSASLSAAARTPHPLPTRGSPCVSSPSSPLLGKFYDTNDPGKGEGGGAIAAVPSDAALHASSVAQGARATRAPGVECSLTLGFSAPVLGVASSSVSVLLHGSRRKRSTVGPSRTGDTGGETQGVAPEEQGERGAPIPPLSWHPVGPLAPGLSSVWSALLTLPVETGSHPFSGLEQRGEEEVAMVDEEVEAVVSLLPTDAKDARGQRSCSVRSPNGLAVPAGTSLWVRVRLSHILPSKGGSVEWEPEAVTARWRGFRWPLPAKDKGHSNEQLSENAQHECGRSGDRAVSSSTAGAPDPCARDASRAEQQGLIEQEIKACRELLELEPGSKWAMLILARLLRARHQSGGSTDGEGEGLRESRSLFSRLAERDAVRAEYYRDQGSTTAEGENAGQAQAAGGVSADLSGLGISRLPVLRFHHPSLLHASHLNLSNNRLRSADGLLLLRSLICLDLSRNSLHCTLPLRPLTLLPALRALNLSHNFIGSADAGVAARYSYPSALSNCMGLWQDEENVTANIVDTNQICDSEADATATTCNSGLGASAAAAACRMAAPGYVLRGIRGLPLRVLHLEGNPVTSLEGYVDAVSGAFPFLANLDGQSL